MDSEKKSTAALPLNLAPAKASKAAAKKSAPVRIKVKGKTVVGHALKSDLKAMKPKTTKPARKFGVESVVTLEKLSALLKKKPHTAADLAKIFKRSTIAVKRQVAKVKGVKLTLRAANGKIGRRPNVYSLA